MVFLISLATLLSVATFVGIVSWAWSKGREKANRDSAMLPFELPDEDALNEQGEDKRHE